jgi:hypothetical protein
MTYNKQTGLTFEWGLGRVLKANQQTRKKEPIRTCTEIQVRCWGSWNKKTVAGFADGLNHQLRSAARRLGVCLYPFKPNDEWLPLVSAW